MLFFFSVNSSNPQFYSKLFRGCIQSQECNNWWHVDILVDCLSVYTHCFRIDRSIYRIWTTHCHCILSGRTFTLYLFAFHVFTGGYGPMIDNLFDHKRMTQKHLRNSFDKSLNTRCIRGHTHKKLTKLWTKLRFCFFEQRFFISFFFFISHAMIIFHN